MGLIGGPMPRNEVFGWAGHVVYLPRHPHHPHHPHQGATKADVGEGGKEDDKEASTTDCGTMGDSRRHNRKCREGMGNRKDKDKDFLNRERFLLPRMQPFAAEAPVEPLGEAWRLAKPPEVPPGPVLQGETQ
jgi:hypothetical protein